MIPEDDEEGDYPSNRRDMEVTHTIDPSRTGFSNFLATVSETKSVRIGHL